MSEWHTEEILVTVRAYPEPSAKNKETSCVAGVTATGRPIRLFPIPARELKSDQKFSKYSVIGARVKKATDARPESHNIDVDSIKVLRNIPPTNNWHQRNGAVQPFRVANSIEELMDGFRANGSSASPSLALIRPNRIDPFIIHAREKDDWSDDERAKLGQTSFLDKGSHPPLEYIPYRFKYRFTCSDERCTGHTYSILDWEVCQAYRNFKNRYGPEGWEEKMMEKFEGLRQNCDLQFFVGTISAKPWIWTIIGIYYPKQSTGALPLFPDLVP